jgi:trehalose/maltose hydrolase-like predicted phosphorylase
MVGGIVAWKSELHQTWSATGYLRLMVFDLAGMNFDENGVVFEPHLPEGIQRVDLTGISYRKAMLNVHVHGVGGHIAEMTVNGRREPAHRVAVTAYGNSTFSAACEAMLFQASWQMT